jgi:hypothetical protein
MRNLLETPPDALITAHGYDALPLSTGNGYRIVDERGLVGYLWHCAEEHERGGYCPGLYYTLVGSTRQQATHTKNLPLALSLLRSVDKGARMEMPR